MRFIFTLLILFAVVSNAFALPLQQLNLPKGFHIQVYAHAPGARQMALAPNGVVFVGTRTLGKVYALIPDNTHTKAKNVIMIASKLDMPNAVAFYQGDLYVAEVGRIVRYPDILQHLKDPKSQQVTDKLPKKYHHGWRYIRFGPDGWLYIAIGAPCNACISKDPRFATIMRMRPNGTQKQIFARGVRNSLGFDWNPENKTLWFTDNGRDWLGDNVPPDELNSAPRAGMNFGFPYYYGKNVPDPKFGKLKSSQGMTPAIQNLAPHAAALGMRFYTGKQFPVAYHGRIFIAEHGSWNRSRKIGYRVTMVTLKNGRPMSYQPFITGWLQGQINWGRPVDVLLLPDGSMLISDDQAGVVYRVFYQV